MTCDVDHDHSAAALGDEVSLERLTARVPEDDAGLRLQAGNGKAHLVRNANRVAPPFEVKVKAVPRAADETFDRCRERGVSGGTPRLRGRSEKVQQCHSIISGLTDKLIGLVGIVALLPSWRRTAGSRLG